jgi:hypothetical protein
VRSEPTVFRGGPLDGRVLPVLTGPTGQPPTWYEVPVPDPGGGSPVVHTYRRVPAGYGKRLGLQQGWAYTYESAGRERRRPAWPWSKRARGARGDARDTGTGGGREAGQDGGAGEGTDGPGDPSR